MFADKNRIINFIFLNYINLIVLFNQYLCLKINEENLINNNESSVIDQPMIHLNDQIDHLNMMDMINNLTNYSNDNFKKLNKQSRSGISVVYSELNDKKDNYHSSIYLKDNNYDDQMNSQDYAYLEESTNFIDKLLKKNLPRKNLIYKPPSSHLIFENNDDEDNQKCINKSTNLLNSSLRLNTNKNSQLESEISRERIFLNSVNSSNFKNNFNDDKINTNLPNKLFSKNNLYNDNLNNLNNLQHLSTDTIIYKTPFNLENDYLDFKFMTRQPSQSQFILNRFIPPSKNQLTKKSSSSSNFLSKKNNLTPEIDFLKNKFINQNKFNRENDKKLDNQFKKRLNSEENYSDDDEFKILNQNDNNHNDNELNNNNQDLNYDFEFNKEFKNKKQQINKVNNNNEMLDQIYTQIQEQNYNTNLNKYINQFLNKQKEIQRKKKYSNYYLQYLQNHPPIKYIPLHHVNPIKKTRSHSKFKYHYHPLNMDRRSIDSYFNSPFMPIFNNPSTFSPPTPNWYYRKQKPKVDDSLYRKLIWLRKQNLINSILNTVNKQSSRVMNHELQPDSSDDLYSYSTMADLDLSDYENDITMPQGQSLSSVYDYPMMMSYPQPYKYIPATPPQPIIMPAPMINYYDPYRYSVPKYQSQDDYHKHTEHHHEHYAHLQPAPISYVTRNSYKKQSSDLKDMLWPLLFAVVLPLTFGALLLPLTLMFLVNLFMLLQILRNPNANNDGGDGGDGGPALAKINKYKSELLSMSPRTDLTNSTAIISNLANKNQRRLKRTTNKSPFLNQRKINEIHLRLLKALIQIQQLFNQPN